MIIVKNKHNSVLWQGPTSLKPYFSHSTFSLSGCYAAFLVNK